MPSVFNWVTHAKSPDKWSLQASGSSSPKRCAPKRAFWQATKPIPISGAAPETIEFFRTLDDLGSPGRALWASAGGHVAILLVHPAMPLVFTDSLHVSDVSEPAELRLPKIGKIETAEVAIPTARSPVLGPEAAPTTPPKS